MKRWGNAAVAAPAAGYGLVAASGRLVAIGNIIVALAYYMLVVGSYRSVAAGRQPEDRPLLEVRAEERTGAKPLCAFGLTRERPA